MQAQNKMIENETDFNILHFLKRKKKVEKEEEEREKYLFIVIVILGIYYEMY